MKKLLFFTLIISILGISFLLILSLTISPEEIKINQINSKHLNKQIKVMGEITFIKNFNNFQLIKINDSSSQITIINFNPNKNLLKKQKIIAIGKVQEYNNTLEINSKKIYLITLKLSRS